MAVSRKATVDTLDQIGRIGLLYDDGGATSVPLPRPFLGGVNAAGITGLHYQPRLGDRVLGLGHGDYGYGIAGVVSITETPTLLPQMAQGETCIWGPRGDVLSYATATGPMVLYRNAAGTLSVTVNPATNQINLVASGGLWVNGVQVTVP